MYPIVIFVIYQREKVNYMNNKNALTFMKVEEGIEVDWAQIMFNNLCNVLDRWTKMQEKLQAWGKQEDKKEIYHSTLILKRLFKYMFQEDYKVIEKK